MKLKLFLAIFLSIWTSKILLAATPVISSVSPSSGPVGTIITIIGTNLDNTTTFIIGGKNAIVISSTGTKLVGMVMPGASTGAISLAASGGTIISAGNFTVTSTPYPKKQQGAELVSNDYARIPNEGYSVAISADGNTAIVGGPSDDTDTGAIWIFVWNGSSWVQQGAKLVGSGFVGAASQGQSVAISADGNTVIEGGNGDNKNLGAVWVFIRNNGIWAQQGNKLVGTGSVATAQQGSAVEISADGNTVIVGGIADGRGASWIFTRSGGLWTQQGNKLVGTDSNDTADQGCSVAISADGSTVIIGGAGDGVEGVAWIFTKIGNNWLQQGSKFSGAGNVGQGGTAAVSISADGNTVILGSYHDNNTVGTAWVFVRNNGIWSQQGTKLVATSDIGATYQGSSVGVSADGNTVIMSARGGPGQGVAIVYTRTNGSWTQRTSFAVDGSSAAGSNVSISANGNTAILGGLNGRGVGGAYIFKAPPPVVVVQVTPVKQNAIQQKNSSQCTAGEPIQLGTGTYEYSHTDFRIPTVSDSLNFSRFYNSLNSSINSPVGYGWSHSYNYQLHIKRDTVNQIDSLYSLQYPDGHLSAFVPFNDSTGHTFPLYIGTTDSLQQNSGGDFTMSTKNNRKYHFTSAGKLDQVSDLNGNITQLNYTADNLTSVVGPGGRTLNLTYQAGNVASVSDPLNRTCNFTYDANGNLQDAQDANGGHVTFTYDTAHRMLTAINALGNIIVSNSYDSVGRVVNQQDAYNQSTLVAYNMPLVGDVTVTNPDNSQFIAHHDSSYRKTFIKDELGFTKTYTYDAYNNENSFTDENAQNETRQFDKLGNLLVRNQPGGINTQISYNTFNSPLTLTDPNGNITNFTYDASNNLSSIQLPDKTVQSFTVYPNGQRNTFKDARGNTITYTYSTNGDLLSVTAPNGTKSYTYDAAGRRISTTDENNNTSTITYDNNDNVISIKDALQHTNTFTYDKSNQLITTTDKNGNTTAYTYDKKGRMVNVTNANGGNTTKTFDVMDRLLTVTDPNNNVISYSYDKKGRKTGTTNALGTNQMQYDGVGNLTHLTDGTGKTTDYTYTATYKVKTTIDGLGNTITCNYDKNNNLLSVADPLNKTTAYSYDAMNRLVSTIDALNNTTNIVYDENGNKKTLTDPNGHTQTYTYDAANRLTAYLDAAGNTTGYSYDPVGNIISINKPTGNISKTYDAFNRLLTVTNSSGDNYTYTYDSNGNVLTTNNSAGTTYHVYDKLNELTEYTDPNNKKITYSYDAGGNKKAITYPGNKTVNYTYDKANNLKTVSDWLSHTFSYTYDAASRTTQLLYPNWIHCDYTYDAAGRITSRKNGGSGSTVIAGSVYTLDAAGNRTSEQRQGPVVAKLMPSSKIYSYGNDDRMLKDSVWVYLNDNAGNRISETKGGIKASYSFTVDDRLTKMTDTTGVSFNFGYDAIGQRIAKTSSSDIKKYVVDASSGLSQVLQITDANGVIRSQYVYGQGLLESVDSTDNALYYQFDGQHNTVALTDDKGTVTDTYTYDPFGTMLCHKGNTSQPFTFLGEFGVEQESPALYYVRARYYDAANGRFLSKDSYPYSLTGPQTIDRYVYSGNNPLIGFDFTGLYKNQDTGGTGASSLFFSIVSAVAGGINNLNDQWNSLTDNWYYPIISTGLEATKYTKNVGVPLEIVDYGSLAVNLISDYNDYRLKKTSFFETELKITNDIYPTLASTVATPLGGLVASESQQLGKYIVNKTWWGHDLTDLLAETVYKQ